MSTPETAGQPTYETEHGRVVIKEGIVQSAVVPEILQSNYFFPPGTEIAMPIGSRAPRNLAAQIAVTGTGNQVRIAVNVNVLYGVPIFSEAHHLQVKIKRAVEAATGLQVDAVEIDIRGLTMPGPEAEDEGQDV